MNRYLWFIYSDQKFGDNFRYWWEISRQAVTNVKEAIHLKIKTLCKLFVSVEFYKVAWWNSKNIKNCTAL